MTGKKSTNAMLLGFPECADLAREVAQQAKLDYAEIQLHTFPDGESKLTLPADLPRQVFIYRGLQHPNAILFELLLAAAGATSQGVEKVFLISPYLAYMRQDKAFHPGEVVSQQVFGKLLANYFDGVLTVDAHLHRISQLEEAIPTNLAINLKATSAMAEFLQKQLLAPLLVGPDEESRQWVAAIAELQQLDYVIATKQRLGDRKVQIEIPQGDYLGRHLVLVDDMASSGQTLIQAAQQLAKYKPASISVLVTHALFVDDAIQSLRAAGVDNIWSCNSVKHSSNSVSISGLLAENLQRFF